MRITQRSSSTADLLAGIEDLLPLEPELPADVAERLAAVDEILSANESGKWSTEVDLAPCPGCGSTTADDPRTCDWCWPPDRS